MKRILIKMKNLLKCLAFWKKTPEPVVELTTEEQMIIHAEALTKLWAKAREEKLKIRPWIEWADKEVVVVEYTFAVSKR